MDVELVFFGIDRFNLEEEVQGTAKNSSSEGNGLTYGGWTFWVTTFDLDIGPLEIALPLDEVPPDHLNRGCDDGGGTNRQTHGWIITDEPAGSLPHAPIFLAGIFGPVLGIFISCPEISRPARRAGNFSS
jgi:hypothetical protein